MLRALDAESKLAFLVCPKCGARGDFAPHGSYRRNLVELILNIPTETVLKVKRVRCRSCKATHAIIPFEVVPYCAHSTALSARLFELYISCGYTVEKVCLHLMLSQTTFYRIYKRSLGRLTLLVAQTSYPKALSALFCDVRDLVKKHLLLHRIKPFESGRLPPAYFDT